MSNSFKSSITKRKKATSTKYYRSNRVQALIHANYLLTLKKVIADAIIEAQSQKLKSINSEVLEEAFKSLIEERFD